MSIPEEHRIKWEAEVSKALLVWTNGRDPSETLENDYSSGIVDIDEVWEYLEGDELALMDTATEELKAFLEESLYEEWLVLSSHEPPIEFRVASRHMDKTGIDKFG
jgi:hypothetical protein